MKACFPRSGCGRPWQLSTYKAKLLMSEIILSAVALFQQTSEAAGMCEWRQMGAGPVKKRWKQDAKGESAVAAAPQWASEHFRTSGDFFPVPSYGRMSPSYVT
jgi:hypothetical protein